ncbi:Ada metal-binding domain-containing protein [Deltaproteobacteria bacterium Smac51]|nr:Ada metal-binding domain-containing protein [Deltaproteobacteria bacterium Smac51]
MRKGISMIRKSVVAIICFTLMFLVPAAALLAEVSANPTSGIYHNARCQHYGCKSCTKTFKTAEEAKKAGFRPCRKCGG